MRTSLALKIRSNPGSLFGQQRQVATGNLNHMKQVRPTSKRDAILVDSHTDGPTHQAHPSGVFKTPQHARFRLVREEFELIIRAALWQNQLRPRSH